MSQDITKKVLKLLEEEGVQPKEVVDVLNRVYLEIEHQLWEKINVNPVLLYNLKDTIWYNLEHVSSGGESKGLSDLRYLGSKYPTFTFIANEDIYVLKDQIDDLIKELEDISLKWSSDWTFVQLLTKSNEGWNGGNENPSPVIIYDPNVESPSKYGYRTNYTPQSAILNANGEKMTVQYQEQVLCPIEEKLGTYSKEPLIRQLLEKLLETCKKAKKDNKGVLFDFNQYDYS